MRISSSLWFLMVLLSFAVGCSGVKLNDVPGSISVDGAPPEGAIVMFHPTDPKQEHVATARAGADGKFNVTCNQKKGIPVGSYKVSVSWPDPSVKPTETQIMMGLAPPARDLLDGKYALGTTPLTMNVTSDMKTLPPIEIKTK